MRQKRVEAFAYPGKVIMHSLYSPFGWIAENRKHAKKLLKTKCHESNRRATPTEMGKSDRLGRSVSENVAVSTTLRVTGTGGHRQLAESLRKCVGFGVFSTQYKTKRHRKGTLA